MGVATAMVPGKGVIKIMGVSGDDRIVWDPEDESQVTKAKKRFKELLLQGYKAWKMDDTGKKGVPIEEFDPSSGAILMAAALKGG